MASTLMANAVPKLTEDLKQAKQLILVLSNSWEDNAAKLQFFSRKTTTAPWEKVEGPWDVVIGKNGMAWAADLQGYSLKSPVKQEGDGKAPAGIFTLGQAFGFTSDPDQQLKLSYIPITPSIVCVDDPRSHYYGQVIDNAKVSKIDWESAEAMHDFQQQYQKGIVVNYNTDGKLSRGGSCIFLHVKSAAKGTAGCTAMTLDQITILSSWLNPKANPVVVQLPRPEYEQLRTVWQLPVQE